MLSEFQTKIFITCNIFSRRYVYIRTVGLYCDEKP